MSKRLVGTYTLGYENVRLYLRDGVGGDLNTRPDNTGPAAIYIGSDMEWWYLVGVLLHEAFEFQTIRMGLRFKSDSSMCSSYADFLFVMTHEQFSDAMHRVGQFIDECLPDLKKAYGATKRRG